MRSSTRRTILWALALVVALGLVGAAYLNEDDQTDQSIPPASPSPQVPDDPGDGCGEAAVTDPTDLSVDRTVARCAPGAPEPSPLDRPATVRVAVPVRTAAVAPLFVADALGEFDDENVEVEIVDVDQRAAYEMMAAGEVDVVVGGLDAAFFDAVHAGLEARVVMGGAVTTAPSDLERPQAGLWLRDGLIDEDENWTDVQAQTVLVPGGMEAAALYPIETTLGQHQLDANAVDLVTATPQEAIERLQAGEVGGAWLTDPVAGLLPAEAGLRQVATLPGSEAIDGTVFAPRLLEGDREVGLAYARAIVRTINTHLADGYGDEALPVVAEALDLSEDVVAEGPSLLFDWEVRSGTTTRVQEAFVVVGAMRYERPAPEGDLVDRSLVAGALGLPDDTARAD